MAQQTTAHCQRPSETLSVLTNATAGDVLLLNGGDTRWQIDAKEQTDGISTRVVCYREGSDPRADDYDWRDDPRLIVEYVRGRYAPARSPAYTVRQVGEGVLDEGEVTALRHPDSPGATWTVQVEPDADAVTRLPVVNASGDAVVVTVGDELVQYVVNDGEREIRRVTITDGFHDGDAWQVEAAWGNERHRTDAVEVAAALHADGGGLERETPDDMPDDALVWYPDLEGGDTTTK